MDLILRLKKQLELSNVNLAEMLHSSPSMHYKVYKIPKKTFGFRTIAQPTPAVKKVQKEIVTILSELVEIHPNATAYVTKKSIKDNALPHVQSEYILKVDLENFFNSITPKMLLKALRMQQIVVHSQDQQVIEQFLFWNLSKKRQGKLVLSVGAPSSPFISNLVMYSFDKKMTALCLKNDIIYTRYADDITLSTNKKNILFNQLDQIRRLLHKEFGIRLTLNESKTVFSSKAHNRHITGVTLTNNNRISLGRDRKRYISALIHKFKLNVLSVDDTLHLKGLLSHANHIENDFINKMIEKYGSDTVISITKYQHGE